MTWKDVFVLNNEAVLVTSSKDGNPNGIYVIIKGIEDNKVLLSVCQMKVSLNNIRENNIVCIIANKGEEYYKIKGTGTIYDTGKYLDLAIERNTPGTPNPKMALMVDIKEIYDLDKAEKIL